MPNCLPENIRARIIREYDRHSEPNAKRVAEMLNVAHTTVIRIIREHYRPVRRPGRKMPADDPARLEHAVFYHRSRE